MTEFDKVIRPGGVGKVTASLETSHYRGPIAKAIRVTSDDPATPSLMLQLKAMVTALVDIAPSDRPILRAALGERTPTELTVSSADGKPFDIVAVEAPPSVEVAVRAAPGAEVAKRARKPGKAVAAGSNRYVVALTPTAATQIGRSVANITLQTSVPRAEKIPIVAIVDVQGAVKVVPAELVVPPMASPPPMHIRVGKAAGEPLAILGVESGDPDFVATVEPIQEGREYDVTVRYTGQPGKGMVASRLTIKTNEPTQSAIVVPLRGRIQ